MPSLASKLLVTGVVLTVTAMVRGQASSNLPAKPASDNTRGVPAAGVEKVIPNTPALPSAERNESGSRQPATTGDVPNAKSESPKASGAANAESSASMQPDSDATGSASPTQPPVPTTTILPGASDNEKDPSDVRDLLAPAPLPKEKLSLIGGTIKSIDQVRDKMTLKVYGADSLKVGFDQRTHFFQDGREVTQLAVKPGNRVYVDTQLDSQEHLFAKNVYVQTASSPAAASGQIVSYNAQSGELVIQDDLSSAPVRFRVEPSTGIVNQNKKVALAGNGLIPGALVAVKFSPSPKGDAVARQVSIIVEPGSEFTFYGRIAHLDVRSRTLAVENQSDGKTYEIAFNQSRTPIPDELRIGSQVTILAVFDASGYTAQRISINAK